MFWIVFYKNWRIYREYRREIYYNKYDIGLYLTF